MVSKGEQKSIVIYFPDFVIENPQILTSLCLFHDQVLLFNSESPIDVRRKIEEKASSGQSLSSREKMLRYYIDTTLSTLMKDEVIQVLAPNDVDRLYKGANEIEIFPGGADIIHEAGKVIIKPKEQSDLEKSALVALINSEGRTASEGRPVTTVAELMRRVLAYGVSKHYKIPLVSDRAIPFSLNNEAEAADEQKLSALLAHSAICQLALPNVQAADPEDILQARSLLKDELVEFRSGVLDLTWLLRQTIKDKNQFREICEEANALVNTKIKASLMLLEHRMQRHEQKRIRRILLGSARVMFEAAKIFLPGGMEEKLIAGSKSLFQLAVELDSVKPPEIQIATYLYKVKKTIY